MDDGKKLPAARDAWPAALDGIEDKPPLEALLVLELCRLHGDHGLTASDILPTMRDAERNLAAGRVRLLLEAAQGHAYDTFQNQALLHIRAEQLQAQFPYFTLGQIARAIRHQWSSHDAF
jgi:hypothetical protein